MPRWPRTSAPSPLTSPKTTRTNNKLTIRTRTQIQIPPRYLQLILRTIHIIDEGCYGCFVIIRGIEDCQGLGFGYEVVGLWG